MLWQWVRQIDRFWNGVELVWGGSAPNGATRPSVCSCSADLSTCRCDGGTSVRSWGPAGGWPGPGAGGSRTEGTPPSLQHSDPGEASWISKTMSAWLRHTLLHLDPETLQHPSLEGRWTPWVNAQASRHHPVLFVSNADKLAATFKDSVGRFLWYRVQ